MGKLNMNALAKKQEELKRGGDGSNNYGFDSLKDGKNIRRILPPKGDSDMFYSEGYLHFGLGEDGKTAVTCLKTFDKKCPVCEYLDSIKNSKSKEDKEFYQRARATKRMYISVLNRDSDDEEETPKVLPIGKMILKQVIDIICDPDYGDITDFEEGRDVTITRSGKGMNTEYSVLAKPKQTIASEQLSEEELDEVLPELDTLFSEKSEEELTAILTGEEYDPEDSSDEDEDLDYDDMDAEDLRYLCEERGIKVSSKTPKSKLVRLLLEDDEEEEYDEEEDEEEDVPFDEEEDEDDDLMADVKNAVKNKRSSRK